MDTKMIDVDKHNSSQLSYLKQQKTAAKPHRTGKLSDSVSTYIGASSISTQWKLLPQQQDVSLYITQFCKGCGSPGQNFHCI